MGKPTKLHDVQKLAGRVAALSRFIARLGEKALPFYALMKKSDDKFEWTEEADTAFAQLKKVLSTPLVLVAPKEKEPLLLYIAATHQAVHPIIVVNEAPLSNILNNPSATGHVSLWGIELSPLDITYEKRKAIKSQILPDFTAEWLELQNTGPPDLSSVWTMYFDGSKRIQGAGAGVVLLSPQGDKLKYVLRMSFPQASNNEGEYEALLHGMKMAKACGATRLKIFGDSNLVVQQVMNKCDAISDNMTAYRNLYYYLKGTFDGCEVSHISTASNEEANNLANIGSQCLLVPQGVFWEEIIERSIKSSKVSTTGEQVQNQTNGSGADNHGTAEPEEVMMIEETWMQPYLPYMVNKTLPKDTVQAKRIIRRSKAFVVLQGKLYKKSISGVLQRCVTPQKDKKS
jgi:ribonuclease HI